MEKNKIIYGHYIGYAGVRYWIKAIPHGSDKFHVYARQYSPALQSGWSYWGTFSARELKKILKKP